ncbi:MAG TPA: hypothetical protein VF543_21995 [Pyrinomonadaceae bacterium]|jgi:hypothetical protein
MYKVRDLADIIKSRPSGSYLSAALNTAWRWQRYERDEAAANAARARRLSLEAKAQHYGVKLRLFGD